MTCKEKKKDEHSVIDPKYMNLKAPYNSGDAINLQDEIPTQLI